MFIISNSELLVILSVLLEKLMSDL